MTRIRSIVVALAILFVLGGLVYAQDASPSLTGTVGGRVRILPTFGVALSLDLSIAYADLTLGGSTNFDLFPTPGGNEVVWLEYSFGMLTLGSEFYFTLLPPGLDSIDAYADADLFDIASDDGLMSFSGQLKLWVGIVPNFSANLTGTFSSAIGPLSLNSTTVIDLLPFGLSSQGLSATLELFDTSLGDDGPSFSGDLGGDFTLYPTFSGSTWISLTASLDGITFTSKTTFVIAPFGFGSQYMKVDFDLDPFSFYISATFTTADPQAEAGFSYSFP